MVFSKFTIPMNKHIYTINKFSVNKYSNIFTWWGFHRASIPSAAAQLQDIQKMHMSDLIIIPLNQPSNQLHRQNLTDIERHK